MKRQRITYGVFGMMEYQAVIKIGRSNMKVLFTDGALSAMGTNPARFTTDNFMVQHAIENSPEFKNGKIRRISSIELQEDVKVLRNATLCPQTKEVQNDQVSDIIKLKPEEEISEKEDATLCPQTKEAQNDQSNIIKLKPEEEISERGNDGVANDNIEKLESDESNGSEIVEKVYRKKVEVACNDDARDYLETNFGVIRSKLRLRANIISVGEANGIEFVFGK